jgi:hypothetical protein
LFASILKFGFYGSKLDGDSFKKCRLISTALPPILELPDEEPKNRKECGYYYAANPPRDLTGCRRLHRRGFYCRS